MGYIISKIIDIKTKAKKSFFFYLNRLTKHHKVAYFGGSFDPIHLGHLTIANDLQRQLNCRLYLLLSGRVNSDKQPIDWRHRYQMLKLAVREYPNLYISRLELTNKVTTTYQTLCQIRAKVGSKSQIYFCIGSDSLKQIHLWYNWNKLLQLCHLVIYNRDDCNSDTIDLHIIDSLKPTLVNRLTEMTTANGCMIYMKHRALPMNSTAIRKDVTGHCDWLNKQVQQYIQHNYLYHNV